jgi:hypothetical protein
MRRAVLALLAALLFGGIFLLLALLVDVGGKLYLAGHGVEPPWYDTAASAVVFGGALFSAAVIFAVCWRLLAPPAQPGGGASE